MEKKFITSVYDKNLETIHTLKWLPWTGSHYQNTRLLIICEETEKIQTTDKNYTRNTVNNYLKYNNSKIFSNIERAIFLEEFTTEEEKKTFWKSISFCNLMESRIYNKEQPKNENFEAEWKTIFEIINVLKPKRCLFFSVNVSESYRKFQNYLKKKNYSIIDIEKNLDKIGNTQPQIIGIKNKKENACIFLFMEQPKEFFLWKDWGELIKKEFGEIKKLFPLSLRFIRQRFFVRYFC